MKTDVLIIGGSAGGLLSATASKKVYPESSVTVIRKTPTVMVPCGIPYIFGTLKDTSKNVIPDKMLTDMGIDIKIGEVTDVDSKSKKATLSDGSSIEYGKLVMATGSLPIVPKFIPGHDLENVYPIVKDEQYLAQILQKLEDMKNVVVIGGGFIGVEFAEQLREEGKNVTIVELAPKCLWQAFDSEFCTVAEDMMSSNGIRVMNGTKVTGILGDSKVERVQLDGNEEIEADAVVMGLGVVPNSDLAKKAGIQLNDKGFIAVDEYMRTSEKDIFAVGDCTEKKCFFTGKHLPILLASTAAMEAKVAATNLFGLRFVRENKGTIGAFATKLFGKTFAAAGLTEHRAIDEGFEIAVGRFSTMDKHPGTLPNSSKIDIKLIFAKGSGVLLGAQISGGDSVGEMINILSLAVQKGISANELNTFQVSTHPLLTASPVAYPINAAALDALASI